MNNNLYIIDDVTELFKLEKELNEHDYYLNSNKSKYEVFYFENKNNKNDYKYVILKDSIALKHYNDNNLDKYLYNYKIDKPNYNNSLVSLINSIKKNYIVDYKNENSIKELDKILLSKKYKNIVLILLDGFGLNILDLYKENIPFIKENLFKKIHSVFPPTTVAATNSVLSGLMPIESGLLGWQQYFKKYNNNIQIFNNKPFYNNEEIECDILNNELLFTKFYQDFNCLKHELFPKFKPDGFETFEKMCDKIKEICYNENQNFLYCYWDEPDHTMHQLGINHNHIKNILIDINKNLVKLTNELSKDTLVLLISDHGHVNVKELKIYKDKELLNMLENMPGIEPRCASFNVKKEYLVEFKNRFNKYYSSYYDLYTKEEILNEEFFGLNKSNRHEMVLDFIGDFVAIAKTDYTFNFIETEEPFFKGHHAGRTKEELEIGLYILNK